LLLLIISGILILISGIGLIVTCPYLSKKDREFKQRKINKDATTWFTEVDYGNKFIWAANEVDEMLKDKEQVNGI